MPMPKAFNWPFAPITTADDALKALEGAGMGWYAIAALQTVFGIFHAYLQDYTFEKFIHKFFFDIAVYLLAGYLLPRTKSRALALIMFLYSLLVAGLTFGALLGIYKATVGVNIILALIVVGVAYRGVGAAFAYHALLGLWPAIVLSGFLCYPLTVTLFGSEP